MVIIWPMFWGGEVPTRNFPHSYQAGLQFPPPVGAGKKFWISNSCQHILTSSFLLQLWWQKRRTRFCKWNKKKKISGFNVNFRQPSALGSISLKKPLCQLSFWTNTPWKFDERWKENTWKNLSAGWGGWRVLFSQDKSHIEQSKSVWHNSASLLAFTWALEELRHNLDKPWKMTQFIHTNCQEICVYLKKNSLTIETISLPAAAGKSGCQAMPGWRKFYF